MPKNWKTYKLFDFMDINPRMKFDSGKQYSFVEMKDLDPSSRKVLPSNYKKLKGGAKFQNGDTLFARITPCLENGKICQVQGLKDNIGFGSTEFLVFRGKENVSDSDFVYYLSRDPFVKQFAEQNMIGTSGRQRVAKEAFINLEINLPPLPEQKAIASILSAIDDKIENNLAINKTLEDMAMALYKHWFVDFEFPVTKETHPELVSGPHPIGYKSAGGEFLDSELGSIPKGWEVKRLEDFCALTMGQSPKSKFYNNIKEGLPFHQGVKDYGERFPSDETYTTEGKRLAEKGDVLFSVRAPVGRLNIAKNKIILGRGLASISMNNSNHFGFLFYALKTRFTEDDIIGDGTVYKSVNKSDLQNLKFLIPPKQLIKDFNHLVKPNDEKYLNNSKENQILTKLRYKLLPKLISGEVRLKQFREEVDAEINSA